MNSMVAIGNREVAMKDYKGVPVVTFKDIDRVHGRPEGTARKRFHDNRQHFEIGRDFYEIKRSDPMSEKRTLAIPPKGITLITESGYLMLAKSFTDPLAWKVQRQLVDCYFHRRDALSSVPAKQIEAPDAYIPKFWQGQQVVTLKDIEALAGIKESVLTMSICHHREDIKPGEMWLLKGNDLRAFRAAHGMHRWMGSLWVISQQGVYRLASWMRNIPIKLPVWEKEEPTQIPVEAAFQAAKPSPCRMDVPGNQMAQDGIARLRKAMTALDAAIDIYNRHSSQQQHENNLTALRVMGEYVNDLTLWLASVPDVRPAYKP